MVQIASFTVVAAVLASQAAASTTCVKDQIYCGFTLLNGSGKDFDTWKDRVDQALLTARPIQPVDSTHEYHSLFLCLPDSTLKFVDWCIDNPGKEIRCQPASNDACTVGNNDCCGPAKA
ncbi:hypothetical protein QBC37DRAFT_372647 [Rhypophila decipiens]|uniref:Uncharacterized protein n=1 Tax=Rhypophila decipiens TaxID=261697 RepID=A0AAN6YET5_9PEZI|nr:hypothetical protein QBC37DRAFT_372647 [Rhypophila decipiens]